MNDVQLRESMARLVADEPPYDLQVATVLDAGRRTRRGRHIRAAVTTCGAVAAVVAVAVAVPSIGRRSAAPTAPATRPVAPQSTAAPAQIPAQPRRAVSPADLESRVEAAIAKGILSATPAGWQVRWAQPWDDGRWDVDANADDGHGAGRVFVSAMRSRVGALTVHPCADREFAQGARCVETAQQDGRVLVVRELARSASGHATVHVQLFGTEGISVTAEAGNFAVPLKRPTPIRQDHTRRPMKITRRSPPLTTTQLIALVRAVDREVQACLDGACR
jgi:hypothetical protein